MINNIDKDKKITSAGFIVVSKTGRILLGKAESHSPPYCYTAFKGGVEAGEDLLQTAIRELKEESGIDINIEERLNRNISSSPVFNYSLKHKNVYLFMLNDITGFLDDFNFNCTSLDCTSLESCISCKILQTKSSCCKSNKEDLKD